MRRGSAFVVRHQSAMKLLSNIWSFILSGGFVFVLTLFFNGMRTASRTGHWLTPTDEISSRLPFSIVAGVVCGLVFTYVTRRKA